MKSVSLLVTILLFIFLPSNTLYAVPATPFPVIISQPDGTQLTVRLHGDEYFNYKTTVDGYALITDSDGILTYAQLNSSGNLVSSSVRATNIANRSTIEKNFIQSLNPNPDFSKLRQLGKAMRSTKVIAQTNFLKGYPLTGTPKSLVILVNFKDVSFVTPNPKTAFTNLLNQKGYSTNGGTGSATDYFHDSSTGVFNPQFDVVGPFTLPQPMVYYGGNDASGNDLNPRQMVIDACTLAAASGVDFSQYDTDHNGVVDNVFIYYAGHNEAEGGPASSIWPHRWTLADYSTIFNGVSVYDYACTSELRSNIGSNMCGIGTFCHEFGHVLGLPDYYVTSGTDHHTLSEWNIMDYGPYLNNGRTPPSYSAWDRFYLNWSTPTELKVAGDYILDTLTTTNKSYLITQIGNFNMSSTTPTPAEFFTLENRQQTGWDRYLPGHGMLVTHIFYNANDWDQNTVNNNPSAMGVDIVEADGIALTETTSLDPTLSGDPFPGTSNVTSYNPTLRDGTDIHKPLVNIQETNGLIHFHFASNIALTQNLQPFTTVQGTPSAIQSVIVIGKKLAGPVTIAFLTGQQFEMKVDTAKVWGKTITLLPVDSIIIGITVQIRYNPTAPSYPSVHNDTFILTTSSGDYTRALISGNSTRPVDIALTQNLQPFTTVQGTPSASQSVTVNGKKLSGPVTIAFLTGQQFEMKVDTAKVWGKTITLTQIDSVIANTTVQIRYNPTVPSYASVHNDTFVLTTSSGDYASVLVSGTSTRPVYVVPPVANNATDATFTSFVANWNSVYDATGYYLTVYNVANGESTISQGFDNGLTAPIDWTITVKNTSSSIIYSGANPPSLQFSNDSEYVETEAYLLPVSNLSFYIRSLGGSNGGFLVEAQNGLNAWEKVDSIPITSTLYEKNKSYSFSETTGYKRFRFTYIKGIGSITFDDVSVSFEQKLNYNLRESWITATTDTVNNLVPNTVYSFKVRASDKSIYYENITDFSNTVSVKTLTYPSNSKLIATKDANNNITVDLPTNGSALYVYNILGQCIRIIEPNKTTILITDLPKNQVYILKSNNLVTKIAL